MGRREKSSSYFLHLLRFPDCNLYSSVIIYGTIICVNKNYFTISKSVSPEHSRFADARSVEWKAPSERFPMYFRIP